MSTAFSPAQLRASLWAREGGHVYAVIDGGVVPGIAERLAGADVAGWDCLHRGALNAAAAASAPYLVQLKSVSTFTDWLLGEAADAFACWGVLAMSGQAILPMREHCRTIGEVLTPDGQRRPWRWYDPEVLRTILPTLLPGQLDELFAGGQGLVVVEAAAWTRFSIEQGVLAVDTRRVMAAASR
ncbi:MAG TPA: DUF4123 domain-containing protein [Caldimonas sp.]|nr:DUF4123 domain-containing protein [Caldimonas sp.]